MILSTICYLEVQGKTLMLYRNKKENDMHEGKWVGIGGKFEGSETPEKCILREFREETGLLLQNPVMRGVITFPGFSGDQDWMMFLFDCAAYQGELQPCDEGELRWFDREEMRGLNMWEGDFLYLDWTKSGRFFSGEMVYDGERMVEHEVWFY